MTVGSGLLGCFLVAGFARWKGPVVHYYFRHIRWKSFREVFGYGMWAFLGNGSVQLGLYASSAIIGMLIGAAEITLYSIGGMLIGYSTRLVSRITNVMVPDILKAGGRGDLAELRWLMGNSPGATMFLGVPVLVGYMTLGGGIHCRVDGAGVHRQRLGAPYPGNSPVRQLGHYPGQHGAGRPGARAAMGDNVWRGVAGRPRALRRPRASDGLGHLRHRGRYGLPVRNTYNVWMFIIGCRKVGRNPLTEYKSTTLRWVAGAILFAVPCLLVSHVIPQGGWVLFWLGRDRLRPVHTDRTLCCASTEREPGDPGSREVVAALGGLLTASGNRD